MNGQHGGDPKKLARALVTISDSGTLPLRFVAGADAMAGVEQNLATIQEQIDANRDLSGRDCNFNDRPAGRRAWRSLTCEEDASTS